MAMLNNKMVLCILTHINVTESIGTSLEFTSINIGKWLWKSTVHGTMATIKLLEKIYERWSSHCEENNGIRKQKWQLHANFCCSGSIGFFVDWFFPLWRQPTYIYILTLINIVWGWFTDDCFHSLDSIWSFWKRKFCPWLATYVSLWFKDPPISWYPPVDFTDWNSVCSTKVVF